MFADYRRSHDYIRSHESSEKNFAVPLRARLPTVSSTLRAAFEQRERPLVLDGGMGTSLRRLGQRAPFERLSVENPSLVERVLSGFVDARCDIVSTNTFCAERSTVEGYEFSAAFDARWKAVAAERGYRDLPTTLWHESVRLARSAADRSRGRCFVAGSIGPTGLTSEREADLREQMSTFLDAGVDALLVETCTSRAGALLAGRVARELLDEHERDVLLIISFTLSATGDIAPASSRTGEASELRELDADIVALNCGFGIDGFDEALGRLRQLVDVPLGAYPNAGLPEERDGELVYPVDAAEFTQRVQELGARHDLGLIGGCCGASSDHIRRLTPAFPPAAPPQ